MNPLHLLRCPKCAARLIKSAPRRYETLVEHCTDPNGDFGDPGARPTLQCSWPGCQTHGIGAYWAQDGEGPFVKVFMSGIRWIDGNSGPLESFHRDIKTKVRPTP
ncbi:hypothetical protein LCGC14_1004290 [marine sediment metagenome]|uniref:Uncharacterized protein n=1 Tax=marine sediment metagenome TaxID=412755 RepID=A0A0F9NNK9_9ZZZZ